MSKRLPESSANRNPGGLLTLALALLLPWPSLLSAQTTRLSWQEFAASPERVESLRRGIATMQARDLAEPDTPEFRTSWAYWAAMHHYYGPESSAGTVEQARAQAFVGLAGFFDLVEDRDLPADPPGLAEETWAQCEHGTRDFLVWHRAFLWHFESVLREAAGDPELNLPYWDTTASGGAPFPEEFAAPRLADDSPNPLFDLRRTPGFGLTGGLVLDPALTDVDSVLANSDFGLFQAGIERGIHSLIHCTVGNLCVTPAMGRVPTSALDPIFWLHHANIDRLWSCWLRRYGEGALPPHWDSWWQTEYTFIGADGAAATMKVEEVFGVNGAPRRIDVSYENETQCSRLPLPPAQESLFLTLSSLNTQTLAKIDGFAIDRPEIVKSVSLPESSEPVGGLEILSAETPAIARGTLVVRNIQADRTPGLLLSVAIRSKADTGPGEIVGVISFFGVPHEGDHDHGDGSVGFDRRFDITRALRKAGLTQAKDVDVLIRASTGASGDTSGKAFAGLPPEANLRIGGIDVLIEQPEGKPSFPLGAPL